MASTIQTDKRPVKKEKYDVFLPPTSGDVQMSIIQEFKEFAIKGNMMDLAIGVIIGGAFGKIVDSLVKDIIMPLITVITGGGVDFSQKFIVLGANPNNLQSLDALQLSLIHI